MVDDYIHPPVRTVEKALADRAMDEVSRKITADLAHANMARQLTGERVIKSAKNTELTATEKGMIGFVNQRQALTQSKDELYFSYSKVANGAPADERPVVYNTLVRLLDRLSIPYEERVHDKDGVALSNPGIVLDAICCRPALQQLGFTVSEPSRTSGFLNTEATRRLQPESGSRSAT